LLQNVCLWRLLTLSKKNKKDPLEVFDRALKNVSPVVEVKSKRVGGANYQVPTEVRGERQFTLACRWLLGIARGKSGSSMSQRLAHELMEAANNQGEAVKKRSLNVEAERYQNVLLMLRGLWEKRK